MLHGFLPAGPSTSSLASQSSNAGWEGALPLRPKSKTVVTSGLPRCRIQMWLTATRAVSGFRGSTIQSASARRRPVLVAGNATDGSSA